MTIFTAFLCLSILFLFVLLIITVNAAGEMAEHIIKMNTILEKYLKDTEPIFQRNTFDKMQQDQIRRYVEYSDYKTPVASTATDDKEEVDPCHWE